MSGTPRIEQILEEYAGAPRMKLVFPASGQTHSLHLTPELAERLCTELNPMLRFRHVSRRWRHRMRVDRRGGPQRLLVRA